MDVPNVLASQNLPYLKIGGRKDFWIKNIAEVGQFITKNKLKAVPAEALTHESSQPQVSSAATKQMKTLGMLRQTIYGGMKVPHLHFKGNIYTLTEQQWKNFSEGILKGFQEKLARVNTVTFEHVMELSESIDSLV